MNPLVVVGDSVLDRDISGSVGRVCPDAPVPVLDETARVARPGGAALAAVLARRLQGMDVVLVTATFDDEAGEELRSLLAADGVEVVDAGGRGATPEKIRMRCGRQTLLRLDRGGGEVDGGAASRASRVLGSAAGVLVADYGRGMAASAPMQRALAECRRPVVWDPHPRGGPPSPGCRLVTPNAAEVSSMFPPPGEGTDVAAIAGAARAARDAWAATAVVVTRGAEGALLVTADGAPLAVPAPARHDGDTCGAGDAFAATAACALASGAVLSESVITAVDHAARFVGRGGASGLVFPRDGGSEGSAGTLPGRNAAELAEAVRAAGGTVVAAGGCFDILHAGHVSLLESARALGNCLIVCMNSDESVRRLKGDGRPVNHQADRAATVAALASVDAVEIFDEDDPRAVIERLRPDVWVKGGDYDAARLPEAEVLARWGGQAVVVPYLAGRSTTGLLQRAGAGRD